MSSGKTETAGIWGANELYARNLFNASVNDILGLTDTDLGMSAVLGGAILREEQEVLDTGRPVINAERTIPLHDGRTVIGLVSKVPLLDANGQPQGVLGISGRHNQPESIRTAAARPAGRTARHGMDQGRRQCVSGRQSGLCPIFLHRDPAGCSRQNRRRPVAGRTCRQPAAERCRRP